MRRRFKNAFITGITGAGGSYLAIYLKREINKNFWKL